MRILVLTPYLPWPLNSGGNAAQFSTLQCLAADHEFTLLCPISRGQLPDAAALAAKLPGVRVRAIAPGPVVIPLGSRALQWLRTARVHARRLLSRPAAEPSLPEKPAAPLPYYPFYAQSAEFIAALAEEVAHQPEVVQCEFAEMMPFGGVLPPTVARLFVHIQVHHVYTTRHLEVHGASPYATYLAEWMRVQERAYLREFDAIITLSEDDRRSLAGMADLAQIYTSPYPLPADVGLVPAASSAFDGRFIFLGSEPHAPNQDALQWLLDEVWPLITAQLPAAQLVVIGQWSEQWRTHPGARGAIFTGFVDDLGTALRGSVMLVPVRIGSGLRTKILAAFAQGSPVVSTVVGAEGLLARDGVECLLRDDAASFAAAALQLAHDPALRLHLAQSALTLVRTHYSPDAVRHRRNEIYAALVARHRAANAAR